MNKKDIILITGATGMVGKNLYKKMIDLGFENIIAPGMNTERIDLTKKNEVDVLFNDIQPDYVFMIAAKVGGIGANIRQPVEFLTENLHINLNLFENCYKYNVKKVLYLGSSCVYPSVCKQPMKEEYLMTGDLEPTNYGYALAKIVGLKLAKYYFEQYKLKTVCLMPCNVYGTGDHYNLDNSHVLSAIIKKFVDAKENNVNEVELWGDGTPRREFIHVDDLTDAILYFFDKIETTDIINIGRGLDYTIADIANIVSREIDYKGTIYWNIDKPNGMMKKCLDVTKMEQLGFETKIDMITGIKKSIKEYKELIK